MIGKNLDWNHVEAIERPVIPSVDGRWDGELFLSECVIFPTTIDMFHV